MRKSLYLFFLSCLLLTSCVCSSGITEQQSNSYKSTLFADAVYYGTIYTSDETNPHAEAIAVKDGLLSYVGDRAQVSALIGPETKVLDYGNAFLMPGFIDGHLHSYVDAENQAGLILTDCPKQTKDAYLTAISTYINEHPEEETYKGFGWLDSAFIGETPTKEMLDAICNDKPIYLKSEDCHSCWINSAMLALTGITKETPDPVGGVIERDPEGNPNGCFRDTAMDYLVKPYVPVYSTEEYMVLLKNADRKLLSNGYTAINDVIIDPQSANNIVEAYYRLSTEGELKCKVNISILINNTERWEEDLFHVKELAETYYTDQVRVTDVKIFMDGIVESETAFVSIPYEDSGCVGADRWPTDTDMERLNMLTTRINDLGLVAHFHAIGDAAITKALNAIAYAKEHSSNKEIRNAITHLQMISEQDIIRMKVLGVVAVADLGWAPSVSEELGQQNIELLNVGKDRNDKMYPFRTMLQNEVHMSYATDYPAGPILYPFYNLQAGITRQIIDYRSTIRGKEEAITQKEALAAITTGGAYQLGREEEIGSLSVGKHADFIVLDQNLETIDPSTIYMMTTLLATYADGEEVYKAE